MTEPKASGPLWAVPLLDNGSLWPCVLSETDYVNGVSRKCRLLPGHGKWVPAELVEAIEKAAIRLEVKFNANKDGEYIEGMPQLYDAIRAALEGKV